MISRATSVRSDEGKSLRMAGSLRDVTARKLAEEQLQHDALHDALTGLANRVLDVSVCSSGGAPSVYPGSYVDWVDKTGLEAPGVHA